MVFKVTVVHVISLPGSARRDAMAEQLSQVPGLDWRFFDAGRTPPKSTPYHPAAARRAIRRELTAGELGCYGGHMAPWRVIAESDAKAAVILEDDLFIDPAWSAEAGRQRYRKLRRRPERQPRSRASNGPVPSSPPGKGSQSRPSLVSFKPHWLVESQAFGVTHHLPIVRNLGRATGICA